MRGTRIQKIDLLKNSPNAKFVDLLKSIVSWSSNTNVFWTAEVLEYSYPYYPKTSTKFI